MLGGLVGSQFGGGNGKKALAITGDAANTDPACGLSPHHGEILTLAEEESAREAPEFESALARYHDRFGKIMTIIEPLPDFQLFRVSLREGRFVLGFGQAYALSGQQLDELSHIEA